MKSCTLPPPPSEPDPQPGPVPPVPDPGQLPEPGRTPFPSGGGSVQDFIERARRAGQGQDVTGQQEGEHRG
jgi:hypothetical protein